MQPKMDPSKAAMKAALRVLTAMSERHEPDKSDVDELHWYAPADRERPLDELVCDAIQRAIKDREEKRKVIRADLRERALAIHEHDARQEEYQALSTKLTRLGAALQQAGASILGGDSSNTEAAKRMLESVAGDVDVRGIRDLLDEHARLAKLLSDEQSLK